MASSYLSPMNRQHQYVCAFVCVYVCELPPCNMGTRLSHTYNFVPSMEQAFTHRLCLVRRGDGVHICRVGIVLLGR